MSVPPSARVTVLGATGSGKSSYLRAAWWTRARRLLVLDHIGEYAAQANAVGFDQTLRVLRESAHRRDWRIYASVSEEEVAALADILLPFPDLSRSPALALGGMAVSIDEVDRVIGFGSGLGLRDLWRRGRHVGLTVFAASQRPANVSKEVTSMSNLVVLMHIHEPDDLDYMRRLMGRDKLDRSLAWIAGKRYRFVGFDPQTGSLGFYEPSRP